MGQKLQSIGFIHKPIDIGGESTSESNQWLIGALDWCFGILGVPLSNNPFHKGILGIQTTNPNHQINH